MKKFAALTALSLLAACASDQHMVNTPPAPHEYLYQDVPPDGETYYLGDDPYVLQETDAGGITMTTFYRNGEIIFADDNRDGVLDRVVDKNDLLKGLQKSRLLKTLYSDIIRLFASTKRLRAEL